MGRVDKRYVPEAMMSPRLGKPVPVARYESKPPGHSDPCIDGKMTLLLCTLATGEVRRFGVDGCEINSELRMVAWGGYINPRNELAKNWKPCISR